MLNPFKYKNCRLHLQQTVKYCQFPADFRVGLASITYRSWRSKLWSNMISMSWSGNAESPSSEGDVTLNAGKVISDRDVINS